MNFFKELSLAKIAVLAATLVGVFLVVYSPHFSYPFPFHIDEWHHIDRSIVLGNYGEYFAELRQEWVRRFSGMEIGFHVFLLVLSFIVDLPTTLQFMPAVWAVVGAAVLFYSVHGLTRGNFLAAWFSVLFFASIKSNVNLTGLWFFTPLTFAIPFIFLYMYLFSEGLPRENKKMLTAAFVVMLLLVPTHSISLLFAIPALLIYGAMYWKYILREWKFFALFLIIPFVGFLFFKDTLRLGWIEGFQVFFEVIQFPRGWGVLELENSIFEIYSFVGLLFAFIGALFIVVRGEASRYSLYLLWTASTLVSILVFRITGFSFLSPFQRTFYYFALSLPILSGIGAAYTVQHSREFFSRFLSTAKDVQYVQVVVTVGVVVLSLLGFAKYYDIPENIDLYQPISQTDYDALAFLVDRPAGHVLATPFVSTAAFAITEMRPLATVYFDSSFRDVTEQFFFFSNCEQRDELLDGVPDRLYIVSPAALGCDWDVIYSEGSYVYQIN